MATHDSTQSLGTERALASRLNPFIGYASIQETLDNVSEGLEFLNLAAGALADGGSNSTAGGLSIVLKCMAEAIHFERQSEGGAL